MGYTFAFQAASSSAVAGIVVAVDEQRNNGGDLTGDPAATASNAWAVEG